MAFPDYLIKKAPEDIDIKEIGFILLSDSASEHDMDLDFELTPSRHQTKTKTRPVCSLCGKDFVNRSNLKRHFGSVHLNNRISKYECQYCNAVFDDKRRYSIHMRCLHPQPMAFTCDFCGNIQPTKEHLISHLEIHQKLDIDIDDIF